MIASSASGVLEAGGRQQSQNIQSAQIRPESDADPGTSGRTCSEAILAERQGRRQ